MFKRLLVPLDGSPFASRALRYAAEVAKRFGSEVVLIQVVRPTTPVVDGGGLAGVSLTAAEIAVQAAQEANKRNAARARRYLRGKVRGMRSREIQSSYRVVIGEAAPKDRPGGYDYQRQERTEAGLHGKRCGRGNPAVRETCAGPSASDGQQEVRAKAR